MASVVVKKNVPPPAPPPPASYDVVISGLSGQEVAQLRKSLEAVDGSGSSVARKVGREIKSQTGNTGEFYSGLVINSYADVRVK